MQQKKTPTIKGIFMKSHIAAVKEAKGSDGLVLLEKKYGAKLDFKSTESIPVRDEVRLLECAVEVLDPTVAKKELSFEAGKLHFRDFLTTPLARILFPFFQKQFKTMMLNAPNIAGHVFHGILFASVDRGDKEVSVIMKNNDYPIAHFQGFLQAWMEYSGLQGKVEAVARDGSYEYQMKWQ